MRTALSTVNLVVGGLVLLGLALLALVGIIAVNDTPSAVPEALWTVVGGVVGALGAMLARTSVDPPEPSALATEPQDAFYAEQAPVEQTVAPVAATEVTPLLEMPPSTPPSTDG